MLGQSEVATAKTTAVGGNWSTSTLSSPLPSGANKFSAFATEKSGIGTGAGTSSPPVEFEVDTLAPEVAITKGPEARSNHTSPTFEGTASEEGEVVVHILENGKQISTAGGQVHAGSWSAAPAPLPSGNNKFTA